MISSPSTVEGTVPRHSVVCFTAFLLVTQGPDASNQAPVVGGAFQLQTYGAAIIAGTLTGVPGGLASGVASALAYVGILWHVNGDSGVFIENGGNVQRVIRVFLDPGVNRITNERGTGERDQRRRDDGRGSTEVACAHRSHVRPRMPPDRSRGSSFHHAATSSSASKAR